MSYLSALNITVFQFRAARRALNLSVRKISKDTGLSTGVIVRIEAGDLFLSPKNVSLVSLSRLKAYLESHDISFMENNTLSLSPPQKIIKIKTTT